MKNYLKAYNISLAIGWSILFIYAIFTQFQLDSVSLILLNICQLSAVLEILHAYKKWVPSPLVTTFIQVFSRVFITILIDISPETVESIRILGMSGVQAILIAWSITEIIRYSYYYVLLIEKHAFALKFFRYTLFIVLYPLGLVGEALIVLSFFYSGEMKISLMHIVMLGILLMYAIFFPRMYGYMWKQRKKKLV